MKKLIAFSFILCLIIGIIIILINNFPVFLNYIFLIIGVVNSDEAADLKLNNEKKEEAINLLTFMLNQTTSMFVKQFGGRLLEGAKDLAVIVLSF
jgi:hypothetical protein